ALSTIFELGSLDAQKGAHPYTQQCGTPTNPCPAVAIVANTFAPAARPPESGPYTYTITVQNLLATSSLMTVTCVAGSSQLPCLTPNPSSFTLAGGATQVVTVGYQT